MSHGERLQPHLQAATRIERGAVHESLKEQLIPICNSRKCRFQKLLDTQFLESKWNILCFGWTWVGDKATISEQS